MSSLRKFAEGVTDPGVDSAMAAMLSRLKKRDPTTRLRALQELSKVLETCDEETLTGVVQAWPRLYNRLAMDSSRRIRELTQRAWHIMVTRAQKKILPALKPIMGVWLCSMRDTHTDAASLAKKAFEDAFPEDKRTKSIAFCHHDVLLTLTHNIMEVTLGTLRDAGTGEDDVELAEKLERIQATSIMSLHYLLKTLPLKALTEEEEAYTSLLQASRLWKLSKGSKPLIHRAVCDLAGDVLTKHGVWVAGLEKRIIAACMKGVSSSNATTAAASIILLYTLTKTPEVLWPNVNVTKDVITPLKNILEDGGGAAFQTVFPLLPHIVAALPDEVTGNMKASILQSVQLGLSSPAMAVQDKRFDLWLTAFTETIAFLRDDPAVTDSSVVEEAAKSALAHVLTQPQLQPHLGRLLEALEASALAESSYVRVVRELRQQLVDQWCSALGSANRGTSPQPKQMRTEEEEASKTSADASVSSASAAATAAQRAAATAAAVAPLVAALGRLAAQSGHAAVHDVAVTIATAMAVEGIKQHAATPGAPLATARLVLGCGLTTLRAEDASADTGVGSADAVTEAMVVDIQPLLALLHDETHSSGVSKDTGSDSADDDNAAAVQSIAEARRAVRDLLAAALQLTTSASAGAADGVRAAAVAVAALPVHHAVIAAEALAVCTTKGSAILGAGVPVSAAQHLRHCAAALVADQGDAAKMMQAAAAAEATTPHAPVRQEKCQRRRGAQQQQQQHQGQKQRGIGRVTPNGVAACSDPGAVVAFLLSTHPVAGAEGRVGVLPEEACAQLMSDIRTQLMVLRYTHADLGGGSSQTAASDTDDDDNHRHRHLHTGDDDGARAAREQRRREEEAARAVSWLIPALPRLLAACVERCVLSADGANSAVVEQVAATLAQVLDAVAVGEAAVLAGTPLHACRAVVQACETAAPTAPERPVAEGAVSADQVLPTIQRTCVQALAGTFEGHAVTEGGVWGEARLHAFHTHLDMLNALQCFGTPKEGEKAKKEGQAAQTIPEQEDSEAKGTEDTEQGEQKAAATTTTSSSSSVCMFIAQLERLRQPLMSMLSHVRHLPPRASLAVEAGFTFGECELGAASSEYSPMQWSDRSSEGSDGARGDETEQEHALINTLQAWVSLLTYEHLQPVWTAHPQSHVLCVCDALVLAEAGHEVLAATAAVDTAVAHTLADCSDALATAAVAMALTSRAQAVADELVARITSGHTGGGAGAAGGAGAGDSEAEGDDEDEEDDEDDEKSPGLLAEIGALATVVSAVTQHTHEHQHSSGAVETAPSTKVDDAEVNTDDEEEEVEKDAAASPSLDIRKWLLLEERGQHVSSGQLHVIQTLLTAVDPSMLASTDMQKSLQRAVDMLSPSAVEEARSSDSADEDDSDGDEGDDHDDSFERTVYPLAAGVSFVNVLCQQEYMQQQSMDQAAMQRMSMAGRRAFERQQQLNAIFGCASATTWRLMQQLFDVFERWETEDEELLDMEDYEPEELPRPQERRKLTLCTEYAKLAHVAIDAGAKHLTAEQWDLILCRLVEWLQVPVSCAYTAGLVVAAAQACAGVAALMNRLAQAGSVAPNLSPVLAKIMPEWQDFFVPQIAIAVLTALQQCGVTTDVQSPLYMLAKMLAPEVAPLCPDKYMHEHARLTGLVPLLYHGESSVRGGAYFIICHLIAGDKENQERKTLQATAGAGDDTKAEANQEDDTAAAADDDDDDGTFVEEEDTEDYDTDADISHLKVLLDFGGRLPEHRLGGSDGPQQHNGWVHGHLLLWTSVSVAFTYASQKARAALAAAVREERLVDNVLTFLFERFLSAGDALPASTLSLLRSRMWLPEEIQQDDEESLRNLAIKMFHSWIVRAPAVVRQWWQHVCPRRYHAAVKALTSTHISPVLIERELEAVHKHTIQSEDSTLRIRSRFGTGEVIAKYTYDTIVMELILVLSPIHPLFSPGVECGRRIGVSDSLWRSWMLQVTMFMKNQNGGILDALKTWKQNVDKKFAGMEECTVCFSIVHGSNYQLPKVRCPTCRKLFHADCLDRWFRSSGNNTCPLCRSLM